MPLMRRTLGLTRASRFEDVVEAGERFANELDVSSSALRWRLVVLGQLTRATAQAVPELALRNNGGVNEAQAAPPLFSRPFMEVIASVIDQGYLSVRRASALAVPGFLRESKHRIRPERPDIKLKSTTEDHILGSA